MRYGYNRVFLDGVLDAVRVTKNGAWFLLELSDEVFVDCGSSRAVVIGVIGNADVGDRFIIRGSLRTKPTRVVVDDVLLLCAAERPATGDAAGPVVRALPQEEYGVRRHLRTLASGRVVWVKSHVRGKQLALESGSRAARRPRNAPL